MSSMTHNARVAVLALLCGALAACSSGRSDPLAPTAPPQQLRAADAPSASLRSGYMLSTGYTQAPKPEEQQTAPRAPQGDGVLPTP